VAAPAPLVPVALASCCTLFNVNVPSAPFCRQPVIVMLSADAAGFGACGAADWGAGAGA
jgi:hypothetical protein